jgi:hypothetical protein
MYQSDTRRSPAGLFGDADIIRHHDGVNEAPDYIYRFHGFPCCILMQLNAAAIFYFCFFGFGLTELRTNLLCGKLASMMDEH